MKYLVSDVESWGKELDAMPAPDPGRRKVGKKEAVFLLAKKLQAAARRGFSTAELLEVLASKGLTVHIDTVRAALKLVGRSAATRPGGGRRSAGAPKVLPAGSGSEPGPTSVQSNAGVSVGDRPLLGAEAGPESGPTTVRGAVGQLAEAKAETDTAPARSNSGASDGVNPDADVGVGRQRDLGRGRREDGEVAEAELEMDPTAGRSEAAGSEGTEPENGTDSGAVERAAADLEQAGAPPVSAAVDGPGRGLQSPAEVPGKQVGEAAGRSAAPPAGVTRGGPASSSRTPERKATALAPVRGSFTPREDSDEI